jgi:hypothetical protein
LGCKLHRVVKEPGELLSIPITPSNPDDLQPVADGLPALDGKVSKALAPRLLQTAGIEFWAHPKRNRKNHRMRLTDQFLARKRARVETILDQLKHISQIEPARHRRPAHFRVNVIGDLIIYCHPPKKPSLNLDFALPPSA